MSRLDFIPDIDFININPEKIISNMINVYQAEYEKETGNKKILKAGDSERIEILTFASMIVSGYEYINYSAKQNLLKYSNGNNLDNLGALVNTTRNVAQKAITTERFNLSSALTEDFIIPKGTMVSAGNNIFFETTQVEVISVGSMYKDVVVKCTTAGNIGNEYVVGQINVLVDSLAHISSVSNLYKTQGGADEETDDSFAERIYLKPSSFSVAGPAVAYEYFAKEYSTAISNVKVNADTAGNVTLLCLLENGEIPQLAFLTSLKNYLNDKRPLTDNLTVSAPTIVNYSINLTYYIAKSNANIAESIKSNVISAINRYITNVKSVIGKDINPDELIELIRRAGAKRANITSPVFTVINNNSVAVANINPTVTFGGIEDD